MIGFDSCCGEDNGGNVTLGKIKLTDANGDVFTDLAGALAYVQEFTTAAITETSFSDGVFYFTVPANTEFLERDSFCSLYLNATNLKFEDNLGLVTAFDNFAFYQNGTNNILGSASFKQDAFRETSGSNTLLNCTFTGSHAFANSSGNNVLGVCNFEKGYNFYESSGSNTLLLTEYDIVEVQGYNFYMSSGNNKFLFYLTSNGPEDFSYSFGDNEITAATFQLNCFNNSSGNNIIKKFNNILATESFRESTGNNIINRVCFYGNGSFFQLSTGNNIIGGLSEFYGENFNNATGNNSFGAFCYFNSNSFNGVTGNNNFGKNCNFGSSCFNSTRLSSKNNFEIGCTFLDNCFTLSDGNNTFSKSCSFGNLCFNTSHGINNFDRGCQFGDNCFQASSSNNNFGYLIAFGNDCFDSAAPQAFNTIESILSCGSGFAKDYTGRFDITSELGNSPLATLPSDIFTTSNICSIHIPNALQYNNAGGPDGDLVNLLANVTNPDSLITYD